MKTVRTLSDEQACNQVSLRFPLFSQFLCFLCHFHQLNVHELPTRSLQPGEPKQSSWPNAPKTPPDPMPGQQKCTSRPVTSKAKTEAPLETTGALRFLPFSFPCSAIPGQAKCWQSCS